jgi:hypothetical protein
MNDSIMTPDHKDWDEFIKRLDGIEGCNSRPDDCGYCIWECDHTLYMPYARALLAKFEGVDVNASIDQFISDRCRCDCWIVRKYEPERD